MKIDRLVLDPRRRASTQIVVAGRVAWTVPTTLVQELQLTPGGTVAGAAVARLEEAADTEGAFRAGLRALERRAHGVQELLALLERRGHPAAAAAEAVARLQALRLLDDRAYATEYLRSRLARGRAPRRIAQELHLRGVAPDLVAELLRSQQGATDGEEPLARARALVARRAPQLAALPPVTRRRRLVALLLRRGYRQDEAAAVVTAVLREAAAATGDPGSEAEEFPVG